MIISKHFSLIIVIRGNWLWKTTNIKYKNNLQYYSLCWKLPEGAQSFVFCLANWDGINYRNVFIGQYNQNAGKALEHCAPSGSQKHITKGSEGFHNHSNLLTMVWWTKRPTSNRYPVSDRMTMLRLHDLIWSKFCWRWTETFRKISVDFLFLPY